MHTKSILELSQSLQNKTISSTELTQHYLQRIQKLNPTLNAFITVCGENAIQQAKAADLAIARGEHTPLLGIPIAHKDIFCTKGIKTTCASKMLDNFYPSYDATVVQRFAQAGMVMLGKTNLDEFAMGSSNENSAFGPVLNPWDLAYSPGGSSGGSATAVAAELIPTATGTDTGGSMRQPSAFCNLTSLKPTYGRISRHGMIAFASSLDQGGVLAHNAEEVALLMNAIAGHDPQDSTSAQHEVPDFTALLHKPLHKITVGLPKEYFSQDCCAEMQIALDQAIQLLTKLGVHFKEINLPHTDYGPATYYIIAPAEASSNLARYDGVRYGHRCENPKDLLDLYCRSRAEGFGVEVKRRIMIGTYVLSAGFFDAYYQKALQIRRMIRNDFLQAFETVDVILTPTTPAPPFKLGEKKSPLSLYLADIFTIPASLAGLPAIDFPGAFAKLPCGLQLIGRAFDEVTLLNVVAHLQRESDWHQRKPTLNLED